MESEEQEKSNKKNDPNKKHLLEYLKTFEEDDDPYFIADLEESSVGKSNSFLK